jgi:hypothetical protein
LSVDTNIATEHTGASSNHRFKEPKSSQEEKIIETLREKVPKEDRRIELTDGLIVGRRC